MELSGFAQTPKARELLLQEDYLEGLESIREKLTEALKLQALKPKQLEWFVLPRGIEALDELDQPQTILAPSSIVRLRELLEVLERTRTIGRAVWQECEPLFSLCAKLTHLENLNKIVQESFDHQGMVRPDSSLELLELAYELTQVRKQTEAFFEQALSDPKIQNFLQDHYVTVRNGRFVLPIKEEMMGRFRGIVQDVSKSEHTVFMEPLAFIRYNNLYRQRSLEYEEALERFRRELQEKILAEIPLLKANVDHLVSIDALVAKAKFIQHLNSKMPKLTPTPPASIQGMLHPLLQIQGRRPVPHDFDMEPSKLGLVVTGPNGGGKTVFLSSIGLNVLLVQKGLLPCMQASSVLLVPRRVFAAMAEGENLKEGLSSFTGYLVRLKEILEQVRPGDFILMDEPLRNTDPLEGSLLLEAILEDMFQKGAFVFIATHNPWLKSWAKTHPAISMYTMDLDPKTHTPTFRLSKGEVSESFALDAARQAGFPESIIRRAFELKSQDPYLSLKDQLSLEKMKLMEERKRVQGIIKNFEERLEGILAQAETLKSSPRHSLASSIKQAFKEEGLQVFRELAPGSEPPSELKPLSVEPGDRVRIEGMKEGGMVASLDRSKGQAEVLVGGLKVRLPLERIKPLPKTPAPPPIKIHFEKVSDYDEASSQARIGVVDVRGMDFESALEKVDREISRALVHNQASLKVLHGLGTLRKTLREALMKNHEAIAHIRPGEDYEGGEAFSVIELR